MHTGTHKPGNQAFRRFRNTFLRNYTECPGGLYKYRLGHAGKDMSDFYDKIKEDIQFRKKWVSSVVLRDIGKKTTRLARSIELFPTAFPNRLSLRIATRARKLPPTVHSLLRCRKR